MTLKRLLFWLPVVICALGLLQAVRSRNPAARAARGAALTVLGTAGASFVLAPAWAPWLTSGVFVPLVLVPALLQYRLNRLFGRQDYAGAARVATALHVVAPHFRSPASTSNRRLLAALALASGGDMAAAAAVLDRLSHDPANPEPLRISATAFLCHVKNDWSLLPAGLGEAPDAPAAFVAIRLRALEACGVRDELVRLYARQRGRLGDLRWRCLLFVLAACGETDAVDVLLAGPLAGFGVPVRVYWRGIAALAAGEIGPGRELLTRVAAGPDRLLALAAANRLAVEAPPGSLGPEERALVAQEVAELAVPPPAPASLARAPVTLALIGLNLVAYAGEMLAGGAEDTDTLFRLGGLWAETVLRGGEWWRLASALFLHVGPAHVASNMLALAVFGTRAERIFGPGRTLAIYMAAGLASTGGVLSLQAAGLIGPEMLIGASGAIMGLLGGLLVDRARHWRRQRGQAAAREALDLVLLVALQAAFDLATPEVSIAAHLFGLAGGALASLVWLWPASAPGPALARSRRRALIALAGLAVVLGGFGARRWRGGRRQATPRQESGLGTDLACLRALRFTWITIEDGGPSVDPFAPFGSADAMADLARITGEAGPALLRRYARVMGRVGDFAGSGRLAPGTYVLQAGRAAALRAVLDAPGIAADGSFAFVEAHARLINAMRWDVLQSVRGGDDRFVPGQGLHYPDGSWRVPCVHFKRPFGDMTFYEIDMADILGLQLARDQDGRIVPEQPVLAQLDALYRSMPVALEIFMAHAELA